MPGDESANNGQENVILGGIMIKLSPETQLTASIIKKDN